MDGLTISLRDRAAVVTGATSGFGRAICDVLRKAGARVFGCDIAAEVADMGTGFTRLDLCDRDRVGDWA